MSSGKTPTLCEWAGGMPALERLTERFYARIKTHEGLAPIFAHMDAHHPHFVAQFLAEVLGGPADYSTERGGHPHMIRQHLERHLTDSQRKAWMSLLLEPLTMSGYLPTRNSVPRWWHISSGARDWP